MWLGCVGADAAGDLVQRLQRMSSSAIVKDTNWLFRVSSVSVSG